MNPKQVYPFEIVGADVYDIPLDKLATYSLEVDWMPLSPLLSQSLLSQ